MTRLGAAALCTAALCTALSLFPASQAAAAGSAVSVNITTTAVTEGYFATFSVTVDSLATGQPVPGYLELTNVPASASDSDYYVDFAAVPEGQALPAYGQFGWTDLGAGQVSAPFTAGGTDTLQVMAYDAESTGDPDSSDAGQAIAVAWSASANGPFTPLATIPVTPATLIASPDTVTAGSSTAVTFTLTSATGAPLSGFTVGPEQGSGPSGITNANGTVSLNLDPSAAGTTAFFAETAADNGNNLAGIQYAGPYATAVVTASAPPAAPPPPPVVRSTVILARSDLPYDALVGQVLADRTHWPVYLTPPTLLEPAIISTWRADDVGTVVILGGPQAISAGIASQIQGMGITVKRIWGEDRYGTAAALAAYLGDPSGTAVITGGLSYTDLLSVAAIAGEHDWPILLANQTGIPAVEQPLLRSLSIRTAYVVGSDAVVNETAVATLQEAGVNVIRIEGATTSDPYGTEARLIHTFK
ncbi:MAG: cell wall-binding repeat-containing protein, partial [Clostridia bacterium]